MTTTTTMYIVMIPNHWGRGATPLDAANKARQQAGKRPSKSLPVPRLVFSYDPAVTPLARVDEMGSLCWLGVRPTQVEKVTTKKEG
jgi:hypothetical protein